MKNGWFMKLNKELLASLKAALSDIMYESKR